MGRLTKKQYEYESVKDSTLTPKGFPGDLVKTPPANAGNLGLIPGLVRPPGEGNGNLLHYFCLENTMDRGACWATVHGISNN